MRDIIIGDVHGEYKELCALLEKVWPEKDDRLIFLGDLFDRGPESREVLRKVQQLEKDYGERFVLLLGNHEDYLLKEKLTIRERMIWEKVGRGTTVASFKAYGEKMEDAVPWIREHCRLYWKGEGFQCVHAGLLVDPIEANDRQTLVHDHGIAMRNVYDGPLTVVGHVAVERPMWFAGDGETVKELSYDVWMEMPKKGTICIDTGCGKNGRLTAMEVADGKFRLQYT